MNYEFIGGSAIKEDFRKFSRQFKRYLKNLIMQYNSVNVMQFELVDYHLNHYEIYGFLKTNTGKFIYFDTSDVRYSPNNWYSQLLIRTASGIKDFKGDGNNFVVLPRILEYSERLCSRN